MNDLLQILKKDSDGEPIETPEKELIISIDQYFMGRLDYENHPDILTNAEILLNKINLLLQNAPFTVSLRSGYRSPEINKKAGGSKKSSHMTGEGIDIADNDGIIKRWIKNNFVKVTNLDLFQEHPDHTPTWVHLQTRPTKRNPFTP